MTTEALFILAEIIFNLFCSICCLAAAVGLWCYIQRDRRVERQIRRMWAQANVSGHPLHLGAVSHFAELLGIELEN